MDKRALWMGIVEVGADESPEQFIIGYDARPGCCGDFLDLGLCHMSCMIWDYVGTAVFGG